MTRLYPSGWKQSIAGAGFFSASLLSPTGLATLAVLREAGFLPSTKKEGLGKPGDSWGHHIPNSGRLEIQASLNKDPPSQVHSVCCVLCTGALLGVDSM